MLNKNNNEDLNNDMLDYFESVSQNVPLQDKILKAAMRDAGFSTFVDANGKEQNL